MRLTRRAFTAGAALAAIIERAVAQTRRGAAVTVEQAQIYLIRGLFGVFSTGMDQMSAQLKAQGYSNVSLWSWTDVEAIAADIIGGHQSGDNAHVILIGHSLGSDAVVQVSDRLARQAIPVDLAVTFDITEGLQVPLNVERFINAAPHKAHHAERDGYVVCLRRISGRSSGRLAQAYFTRLPMECDHNIIC